MTHIHSHTEKKYAAELPSDVLAEILLPLPAESLVRLKRVCKSWHRLIGSEQFVRWHLERHSRSGTMMGLAFKEGFGVGEASKSRINLFSLDFESREPKACLIELDLYDCLKDALLETGMRVHALFCTGLYVTHACDGLLLIKVIWSYGFFSKASRQLVCNPTTKSYTVLPPLSEDFSEDSVCMIVHDASVQRYKIIAIGAATDSPCATIACFIFELTRRGEAQGWEELHTDIPWDYIRYGRLRTLSTGKKVHLLMGIKRLILLDLITKSITLAEILDGLPEPASSWCHNTVFSDRVMCDLRWDDRWPRNLELWVLEDFDNPRWRKHHVLTDISTGYYTRLIKDYNWEGIYVEEAGKLIMNFQRPGVVYDMSSGEWREIEYDCPEGRWQWYTLPAYSRHVRSLVRWG